jgi:glycerophosphoryl diester phosphodiesterase
MLELLEAKRAVDRVTIASFKTRIAIDVRRRGFAGETALSQGEVIALLGMPAPLWRALPRTGNAAQVPVAQGPIRFDRPAFIAKCHALGLRVDFWTIDDRDEAARLLALGADGIMTNNPAMMKTLFEPS